MRIWIEPDGYVRAGPHRWRCALGRGGIGTAKREGDGATPAGVYALGRVFYRADRLSKPRTGLPVVSLAPTMGWCDDSAHTDYNRLIALPHPAHHEKMWRAESVYDVVVEVRYNTDPVVSGLGSAIFLHIAKPGYTPTEGCIALKIKDLLELLSLCNEGDVVNIPAS